LNGTAVALGTYFRVLGGGPALASDRRVRVWSWRLAVERPGTIPALGLALAAAHVSSEMRMRHPQAAAHPDAWDVVADDLDSLLPWVLTAAAEFLLVDTDLTTMRDVAHARLGISRMRYGVPVLDCCDLVRRGADRVRVAELAAEYRDLQAAKQQEISRVAFVAKNLTEQAQAAA
jgi:hypothetical protein